MLHFFSIVLATSAVLFLIFNPFPHADETDREILPHLPLTRYLDFQRWLKLPVTCRSSTGAFDYHGKYPKTLVAGSESCGVLVGHTGISISTVI